VRAARCDAYHWRRRHRALASAHARQHRSPDARLVHAGHDGQRIKLRLRSAASTQRGPVCAPVDNRGKGRAGQSAGRSPQRSRPRFLQVAYSATAHMASRNAGNTVVILFVAAHCRPCAKTGGSGRRLATSVGSMPSCGGNQWFGRMRSSAALVSRLRERPWALSFLTRRARCVLL
jgi:hypothetical protein